MKKWLKHSRIYKAFVLWRFKNTYLKQYRKYKLEKLRQQTIKEVKEVLEQNGIELGNHPFGK